MTTHLPQINTYWWDTRNDVALLLLGINKGYSSNTFAFTLHGEGRKNNRGFIVGFANIVCTLDEFYATHLEACRPNTKIIN